MKVERSLGAQRKRLAEISQGDRMTVEEACSFYYELPLAELGAAAHQRRLQLNDPMTVSYLVDRNINYTNVCITDCHFCAFYRRPGDPEAYVLKEEDYRQKIDELIALGGTRVLLQGGHHPDLPLSFYTDLLHFLRREFPSIEINAFSPSEIDHIATCSDLTIREVLSTFKAAGLAGLPGGGGEILVSKVRKKVSPKKQAGAAWIETMKTAMDLGLTTTASMVTGLGEDPEDMVAHLDMIRRCHDDSLAAGGKGFSAFITWTAQLDNNRMQKLSTTPQRPFGKSQYLRSLALSRLFLDKITHIQSSWPTQGMDVAEMGLHFGADDFGSTMLEENVVSQAGTVKTCAAIDEIRGHIEDAGFIPRQRFSDYSLVGENSDPSLVTI